MPIHVFQCENLCGQRVELITKTASAPVPQQIRQKCPRCAQGTTFQKTVGAPAILTPTTKAVARRNDYRRSKPNARENILAGRTSDGRPKSKRRRSGEGNRDYRIGASGVSKGGNRWKNGALIDPMVTESHEKWGDSYTEQYGASIRDARTKKKKELVQSGTKLLT